MKCNSLLRTDRFVKKGFCTLQNYIGNQVLWVQISSQEVEIFTFIALTSHYVIQLTVNHLQIDTISYHTNDPTLFVL